MLLLSSRGAEEDRWRPGLLILVGLLPFVIGTCRFIALLFIDGGEVGVRSGLLNKRGGAGTAVLGTNAASTVAAS